MESDQFDSIRSESSRSGAEVRELIAKAAGRLSVASEGLEGRSLCFAFRLCLFPGPPNGWHMVCGMTSRWLFGGYLPAIGGVLVSGVWLWVSELPFDLCVCLPGCWFLKEIDFTTGHMFLCFSNLLKIVVDFPWLPSRSPSSALLPFFRGGFPYQNRLQRKVGTLNLPFLTGGPSLFLG